MLISLQIGHGLWSKQVEVLEYIKKVIEDVSYIYPNGVLGGLIHILALFLWCHRTGEDEKTLSSTEHLLPLIKLALKVTPHEKLKTNEMHIMPSSNSYNHSAEIKDYNGKRR